MLTNIMVLRTVKENANKAVLDALPSILFEGLHNDKDVQKYYLQGPAAEYIPVNIPDETAKKFSKCATALAMQLILLSNKTKGFFGPEIVSVEGKDILTARNIMNPIMVERNAKYYSTKLNDEVYDAQYAVSEHVIECWEDGPVHRLSLTVPSGLSWKALQRRCKKITVSCATKKSATLSFWKFRLAFITSCLDLRQKNSIF